MKKGMAGKIVVVFLFLTFKAAAGDICTEPVSTGQGAVTGAVSGDGVCVYKGIPYAAPPVGELRWKVPQDALPRSAVFAALEFSPECAQQELGFTMAANRTEVLRSEDCLGLNIWRPAKSGTFPVMFWIHGGALIVGSGSGRTYRGENLSGKKDVVVVTINYRLGAFGFLSHREFAHEDPNHSSGNYGLLDQVKALEWVHNNIVSFGGDPGNVTIFGESAGGWSVCNLLASPRAQGLFDKAIIESGGCDSTISVEESFKVGDNFAARLECSGPGALSCMRGKSTEEVLEAMPGVLSGLRNKGELMFSFVPNSDGWALKETPIEALESGNYNNVPLMIGTNRDEFKFFTFAIPGVRALPRRTIEKVAASQYDFEGDQYRSLYPSRQYRLPADAAIDAIGDAALGCKCFEAAEAAAKHQPAIYYYRFDYDDSKYPHRMGAGHALEIPFVFGNMDIARGNKLYSAQQLERAMPLSETMMGYWTNFAKTGDPKGPGLAEWPAYNADERKRMYLDLPTRVSTTDNVEKCKYWKERQK